MTFFDTLKQAIDRGRAGENKGLSTGSNNIDSVINGILRRTYYLLGGLLGSGKTAFADHCFVLMPLYYIMTHPDCGIKLKIFYRSMEIPKEEKLAKWAAHILYNTYGIITHPQEILTVNKFKISDDVYNKIIEAKNFINRMEEHVVILESSVNPTGIYMDIKKYMDAGGKEVETIRKERDVEYKISTYHPNDPTEIVFSIVDHIGLMRGEKDGNTGEYLSTKKQIIDKWSQQSVSLRNHFGVSILGISQFNRTLADMDRRRFTELSPELEDFKDTGNASEDANIVGTIFNPLRYGITEYGGFSNITQFGGRYRSISWLKSRYGSDMIKVNQNFLGESGYFRDFPSTFMPERHMGQAARYDKFT